MSKSITPFAHPDRIKNIRISPDGNTIVTLSDDYKFRVWDSETGKLISMGSPTGGKDSVPSLAISPDGKTIATGRAYLKLYDAQTGKLIREFKTSKRGEIKAFAFSPSGGEIATISPRIIGGLDNGLRVWDIASGDCIVQKPCKDSYDAEIAWPVADQLIVLTNDPKIEFFNPKDLNVLRTKALQENAAFENLIVTSRFIYLNNYYIFHCLRLVDLEYDWNMVFPADEDLDNYGNFDVSQDGKWMIRAGKPNKKQQSSELIVVDLEARIQAKPIALPKDQERRYVHMAFLPGGKSFVVALGNNLWKSEIPG